MAVATLRLGRGIEVGDRGQPPLARLPGPELCALNTGTKMR
jgi:hypothetical protein